MSPITLKQLEAFYWAATCANFAVAAERVHVSVSSLSRRITELESALGRPLFDRAGHRAVLTEDGRRALPAALRALEAAAQVSGVFQDSQGLGGRCSFGVGELSALTWLPKFMARVKELYPALTVEPCVDVGAVLERQLEKGQLDFAVVAGRSSRAGILSRQVGSARFAWMTSAGVAGRSRTLTPTQLRRFPVITLPEGAGSTRILDDWLQAAGIDAVQRIACNNWGAIAGMLREGLGIGFLPEGWDGAPTDPAALRVLKSQPPLAPLPYSFQWRRDDTRPLVGIMRDCVAQCVDFSVAAGLGRR
jgi:DNA-binding transcriptional LysR family regulator